MKRKLLMITTALILMLLIPTGVAWAYDKVIAAGETINNDIVLIEEDLVLEAGATVNGDVTVVNGEVTLHGTVNGDVVLWNSDLTTSGTAVVNGDCVILSRGPGDTSQAGIECFEVGIDLGGLGDNLAIPDIARELSVLETRQEPSGATRVLGTIGAALLQSLFMGLIAFGVATLFPRHLSQVRTTIGDKPVASGTVGFLTFLAVPFMLALLSPLLVILAFVCGLGVLLTLAIVLAFGGAVVLGWISIGQVFGQRLATMLNLSNRSLPATTALGTAAIAFILALFGAFGGGIVAFIISCIGLGAAALTKFGTKSYPRVAGEDEIHILNEESDDKLVNVLDTLPDDVDSLK